MQLQLDNLCHRYADREVLRGLSFGLQTGEIGCLLGPSGCGKTTALRCIAGFEALTGGEIRVGGVSLSRPGFSHPPEQRQIGMVFQDAALLPHLNALQNVAFGLHAMAAAPRKVRAQQMLATVGLADCADQFPHELSGGQQQRVALARALAPQPRLVLLDEPFANLDAALRERLGRDVRDILKQQGVTALLVTHDQFEAFTLADQIGVMFDGVIAQWGTASDIYHRPVDRRVADFVGSGVVVSAQIIDANHIVAAGVELTVSLPAGTSPGDNAELLLRPDDVIEDAHGLSAIVVNRSFRGPTIIYTLRLASGEILLTSMPAHRDLPDGSTVQVRIAPAQPVLFKS